MRGDHCLGKDPLYTEGMRITTPQKSGVRSLSSILGEDRLVFEFKELESLTKYLPTKYY